MTNARREIRILCMRSKAVYAISAVVLSLVGVRAFQASPQWQRHIHRQAYWRSVCHGFDEPYIPVPVGWYCPPSDVHNKCLFDGAEARAAKNRS